MSCIYKAENCKNHFKIVGQIIFFFFLKKKRMTWQLMWRNIRAAALNATFQLLVIYKCLGWIVEGIIITQNHKSTKELSN